MKNNAPQHRPALTAIAAVLALSSTPALAQVTDAQPASADPVVTAPPVVATPEPSAPLATPVSPLTSVAPAPVAAPTLPVLESAAPAMAPSQPVVQSIPTQTAEASPARNVSPAPRTVTPAQRTAPAVAERPAATSNQQSSSRTAPWVETPRAAAPAATTVAPTAEAAPVATAPVATAAMPSGSDDTAIWLGAGAGLLLVGGVSAYVLTRRRPSTAKAVAVPARRAEPVRAAANDAQELPRAAVAAPVIDTTSKRSQNKLEAMVAAPPSPENPFVTRKARLRRAAYLIAHPDADFATQAAHEEVKEAPRQKAAAMAAAPKPSVSNATKSQPMSKPVAVSFDKAASKSRPPRGLKPATT